jgi:hypothetical protein
MLQPRTCGAGTDLSKSAYEKAEGRSGVFAGGRTAGVGNGKIDQLVLGDFTIKNVPISSLPLRNRLRLLKQTDGILGKAHLKGKIDQCGWTLQGPD